MNSDEAFDSFGRTIKSDPLDLLLARWRRDTFTAALRRLPDVAEVIPSSSLARGTHSGPLHGFDLMVVFDAAQHPDWGGGGSAQAAVEHLEHVINKQLGDRKGSLPPVVRETEVRNHLVTCTNVSLGPLVDVLSSGPPIDVMPAIGQGSHLRIPELGNGRWADIDSEPLIRLVQEREQEWKYFDEVVRMVKVWAKHSAVEIKSLAVEVLVLKYLPRPSSIEALPRGEALVRFFEAAASARITSLSNPAGGEIDPSLNYAALRKALQDGAALARQAVDNQSASEGRDQELEMATQPNLFWRQLFGQEDPPTPPPFLFEPGLGSWSGTIRRPSETPEGPHGTVALKASARGEFARKAPA